MSRELMKDVSMADYAAERDRIAEALSRRREQMTAAELRGALLVEYHCTHARHCVLFQAWASNYGVAFYKPPFVLSKGRNEARSTAAGRARNTTDGINHWLAGVDLWVPIMEGDFIFGWFLTCRHVDVKVRALDIQHDIDAATPGKPIRRRVAPVSNADNAPVVLSSIT